MRHTHSSGRAIKSTAHMLDWANLFNRPMQSTESYKSGFRFNTQMRSFRCIVTRLPASLPIAFRTSALIGNICFPFPIAMNELRKG
jgi:hypothetical protein